MDHKLTLESARLRLRPVRLEDAPAIHAILSQPQVICKLWLEPQTSLAVTEELVRRYLQEPQTVAFAITQREDGAFVGVYLAHAPEERDQPGLELTTYLSPDHWGKGYAGEALSILVDYARDSLHLPALIACALADNTASNRMIQSHGFELFDTQYYPDLPQGLCCYRLDFQVPRMQQPPRPGRYRHFKGGEYRLLHLARHSETDELYAVYQPLYGEGGIWVRPADMWDETVERDGVFARRFTYLGN